MTAQARLDSGEIKSVEEDNSLVAFHAKTGPTKLEFDTPCGAEVCSTCAREVEGDTEMLISCVSNIGGGIVGDANSAADYVISGVTAAVWGDSVAQPSWEFSPSPQMCAATPAVIPLGRMAKRPQAETQDMIATLCLGKHECKVPVKRSMLGVPSSEGAWDATKSLALSAMVQCAPPAKAEMDALAAKADRLGTMCADGCATCATEYESEVGQVATGSKLG